MMVTFSTPFTVYSADTSGDETWAWSYLPVYDPRPTGQELRRMEMAQLDAMNGKPKSQRIERPRPNGRIRADLRVRQKAGKR